MSSLRAALLGAILAVLAACGPEDGASCTGSFHACDGGWQALECREGHWRALPCWGPSGCTEEGGRVSCDMSGNLPGHACATSVEGRSVCTLDGDAVLECRTGALVQTRSCVTCGVEGDLVVCES